MFKRFFTISSILTLFAGLAYSQSINFDFTDAFSPAAGQVRDTVNGETLTVTDANDDVYLAGPIPSPLDTVGTAGTFAAMYGFGASATFTFSRPVKVTSVNLLDWNAGLELPDTTAFTFTANTGAHFTATVDGWNGDSLIFPGSFSGITSFTMERDSEGVYFNYAFDNVAVEIFPTVDFADGSTYSPPVPVPNTDDNPIGRFKLTAPVSGVHLSAFTVKFSGAGTNITGVKLWRSDDNSFGGDTQVGTKQSYGGTVTFSGMTADISTSGTWFFVTLDLGASSGADQGVIVDNSSIVLSGGMLGAPINNAPLSVSDVSLPVQVSSVIAKSDYNSVTISWRTESEVANAGFIVMRSTKGSDTWELAGSYLNYDCLKGEGTSTSGKSYLFTDKKVKSGASYEYKIQSVSISGTVRDAAEASATVDVPKDFALLQNYPNPFNPSTAIRYQLSEVSRVTIMVYDMLGREVETLVNERQDPGVYDVTFNGARLPSGVYYCRMSAIADDGQRFVSTKKLVLMK